jgi:putative redox protein
VGVVTIGAPADASHVAKHLVYDREAIQRDGRATVNLAGRTFTIKKQFLDDLAQQHSDHIGRLQRALLVLHSPVDTIVSIQEAEKIYVAARHPKSFISLDNADHLLTRSSDAEYVAVCISAWASKFLLPDSTTLT